MPSVSKKFSLSLHQVREVHLRTSANHMQEEWILSRVALTCFRVI
jgi:hypothetical protein